MVVQRPLRFITSGVARIPKLLQKKEKQKGKLHVSIMRGFCRLKGSSLLYSYLVVRTKNGFDLKFLVDSFGISA